MIRMAERLARNKRNLIKIICPKCNRFIAYVPVESDLWCNNCGLWVYKGLGGGQGKQKAKKVKE